MDLYHNEENCIICVNDQTKNKKPCQFSVNFDKVVKFDQRMEMALVKICSPNKIFNYEFGDEYVLNLTIMFIRRRDFEKYTRANMTTNQIFFYTFKLDIEEIKESPNVVFKFIERIKEITSQMNIIFKQKWNELHPKVQIPVTGGEMRPVPFQNPKLDPKDTNNKVSFYPIRIFEWLNGQDKLTLNSGKFLVSQNKSYKGKDRMAYHLNAIAFVTFNEKLHYAMGQDEKNFPIARLNESGIDPDNPIRNKPIYVKKQNIKLFKFDLTEKECVPKLINVFTNILHDSFINEKKKSFLQTYIHAKATSENNTIDFEHLLYIPLNCGEFITINLNLVDEEERTLYYEGDFSFILHLRPIHHI